MEESYGIGSLKTFFESSLRERRHNNKSYFGVYATSVKNEPLFRPKLIATLYWNNGKAIIRRHFGAEQESGYDANQKYGLAFLRKRAILEFKTFKEAEFMKGNLLDTDSREANNKNSIDNILQK